jgi:hypothetical protein
MKSILLIVAAGVLATAVGGCGASNAPRSGGPSTAEPSRVDAVPEVSMNFHIEDLPPFLDELAMSIESGFDRQEAGALLSEIRRLGAGDRHRAEFDVRFQGRDAKLVVQAELPAEDTPFLEFESNDPQLLQKIDRLLEEIVTGG